MIIIPKGLIDNIKNVELKKLIEKKILVRDCSTFRGLDNKFIRVAVRKHKENVKLVRALEEICQKH